MPAINDLGIATVGPDADGSVSIQSDGRCIRETLNALERGDHANAMSRRVLESLRTQGIEIISRIVEAYSADVSRGEVGAEGSARASEVNALGGRCPTGLLYGRVQSGKTAAMIVTGALAIDNGFRVIVVLTSNNIKLVEQTADRFADLQGALHYSSLNAGGGYSWDRERRNIMQWLPTRGAVFVCAKEDGHLEALIRFLQEVGAGDYPALILDDEADHATPDTSMARRARARRLGRDEPYYSTTFRLVVENDRIAGFSLRETLRHNVFLQVTATPYGLLLQNLDHALRPAFTHLLQEGEGYTGGEVFFAQAGEEDAPPLVYVGESEADALRADPPELVQGLQRSLAFFILAATVHRHITGASPRGGYKYLCHTSAQQQFHDRLAILIQQYVDDFSRELATSRDTALARPEVTWAISDMQKTLPLVPDLASLVEEIVWHLPQRGVVVVNAEQGGALRFGPLYNFIVGGNILGRGLTIEDLAVTYYLRQARVSQMDTMHQHARMYGYRSTLMPYTRVFLPRTLALRFRSIHESEQGLRESLRSSRRGPIPVQVVGNLRATRSNVLDLGAISAYRPGQQVYPVEPVHDARTLGRSIERIDQLILRRFGADPAPNEYHGIDVAFATDVIETVKVTRDDGDWDTDALVRVLEAASAKYHGRMYFYVRNMRRTNVVLSQGAISGDEQAKARTLDGPTLFLFRGEAGRPWHQRIWYPTVVFPADMPMMVFARDA